VQVEIDERSEDLDRFAGAVHVVVGVNFASGVKVVEVQTHGLYSRGTLQVQGGDRGVLLDEDGEGVSGGGVCPQDAYLDVSFLGFRAKLAENLKQVLCGSHCQIT
jgi:hypothetical protein